MQQSACTYNYMQEHFYLYIGMLYLEQFREHSPDSTAVQVVHSPMTYTAGKSGQPIKICVAYKTRLCILFWESAHHIVYHYCTHGCCTGFFSMYEFVYTCMYVGGYPGWFPIARNPTQSFSMWVGPLICTFLYSYYS